MSTKHHQSLISTPSNNDLRPIAEAFVAEKQMKALTAETILTNSDYAGVKALLAKKWRKEQERIRAEHKQAESAEAKMLEEALRQELGEPVLTAEQLKGQIGKIVENVKKPSIFPSGGVSIPDDVTALQKKFGHMLPENVFTDNVKARTFRGWLGFWTKGKDLKWKWNLPQDPTPEFQQAMENRKQKIGRLFDAIGDVVRAWGFDPASRDAHTSQDDFRDIRQELEVVDGKFYWICIPPKVETAEEKAIREAAKGQEEVSRQAFNELRANLKVRVMEVTAPDADVTETDEQKVRREEQAELKAKHVARKYDGDFRAAAIVRMDTAHGNVLDVATAKIYAKAAGMTEEELGAEVLALQQKREADAQAQSEQVAAARGANFGAEKPATAAKRDGKNDKAEQKPGKKARKKARRQQATGQQQ